APGQLFRAAGSRSALGADRARFSVQFQRHGQSHHGCLARSRSGGAGARGRDLFRQPSGNRRVTSWTALLCCARFGGRERVRAGAAGKRERSMFRLLGWLFSFAAFAGLLAVGGTAIYVWTLLNDLPDYSVLASYEPPVTTRVH